MKKKPNFIALSEGQCYVGTGVTVDEAVESLNANALDYDGEYYPTSQITVYEVQRKGSAKVTVEWISE